MNREHFPHQPVESFGAVRRLPLRAEKAASSGPAVPAPTGLPMTALDDRIAIIGTAGSGKT
jgi:hypothetical protein